jgi:AraC-like DNA-binding protein
MADMPSTVFRAEDEPVASRVDYWKHVTGGTLVPLDIRLHTGPDFRSRIRTGEIGAVRVTELTAPHADATRSARKIRELDPDMCKIDVVASGAVVVEQDGREASLSRGDFTFIDLSRPARWGNRFVRMIAVVFPRALLPLPPNEVSRLTAVRLRGDRGSHALISSLARQLPGHLDDLAVADSARLGTTMVDLLSVGLAASLDRSDRIEPDARQRALLLRIRAFIEAHLGDPDLSPAMIAAAHFISIRSLYKLFATQEHGVAGWIRQRRLERCRRDLLDPALRDRPARAIAARWGLYDATHFSRLFRAMYGLPPGAYRRLHAGTR